MPRTQNPPAEGFFPSNESHVESVTGYQDFLFPSTRFYKGFEILKLQTYEKHYKVKRINPKTMRNHHVMICKYKRCGAIFNKISNLVDHLNVHDKVKPYTCKTCHRSFVQFGNLRRHMRLTCNAGEKPA